MAFPAILGVSVITTVLLKVGELFLGLFAKRFAANFALRLAYIAMFLTVFSVFAGVIQAAISTIHYVSPPMLSKAIGHFTPETMPLIMGAYFTAHIAEFVMTVQVRLSLSRHMGYKI